MKLADKTLDSNDYIVLANKALQYINPRVSEFVKGKDWILATAASYEYVKPLASRLDCRDFIATVRPISGKFVNYVENRGEIKLSNVHAVCHKERIDTALSDHHDDLPILKAARTAILVNPSKKTLATREIKDLNAVIWR